MHNTQRLMKGKARRTLMMNPVDAERLGAKSGDMVTVSSKIGQVVTPIEITGDMLAGVVSLPHGFGHGRDGVQLRVATKHPGVSVNDLTDDQLIDALSGNAVFSAVPVKVTPAAQSAAAESTKARGAGVIGSEGKKWRISSDTDSAGQRTKGRLKRNGSNYRAEGESHAEANEESGRTSASPSGTEGTGGGTA
jgi:hypothetical protein